MKAASRSGRTYGFQIHAFVFVATMALLVAINLYTGQPYWIFWVLLGWGIGLLTHWWFGLGPGAKGLDTPK